MRSTVPAVEQRAEGRTPSKFVGMRLNSEDQRNLQAILVAGLAENTSDAIRCGLKCASSKARRLLSTRKQKGR